MSEGGRFEIVVARAKDLGALSAIERSAAERFRGLVPDEILEDDATSEAEFAAAQAEGMIWVALVGDSPVGFALVEMLSDGLPHLDELDVIPSHGRRGIGGALVRTVCEWARRGGCAEVTLTTYRDIPWNRPFYARLGFVEIPAERLRPALAAAVREEAGRGLVAEARVVMSYACKENVR